MAQVVLFMELEHDRGRCNPVPGQGIHHQLRIARVLDLGDRHVEADVADGHAPALPGLELFGHLPQRPGADGVGDSGFLGQIHELRRVDAAAAVVLPAQQRLDRDGAPGFQLDLRLIHQLQLTAADRQAQLGRKVES